MSTLALLVRRMRTVVITDGLTGGDDIAAFNPDEPRDKNGEWSHMNFVARAVYSVADAHGFPHSKIVITSEPRSFELNGHHLDEAGSYDPTTGIITIRASEFTESTHVIPVMEHEIEHAVFHEVESARRDERAALFADPAVVSESYRNSGMKPDGTLRTQELKDKYPLYTRFQSTLDAPDVLYKADGISSYSKMWWDAVKAGHAQTEQAINETLAEVASQDAQEAGFTVKPVWRKLYNDYNKTYQELKAKP
jgi:hypothetical protein